MNIKWTHRRHYRTNNTSAPFANFTATTEYSCGCVGNCSCIGQFIREKEPSMPQAKQCRFCNGTYILDSLIG